MVGALEGWIVVTLIPSPGVQKRAAHSAVRRALFKDSDQLRPFKGEFCLSTMAARSGVP